MRTASIGSSAVLTPIFFCLISSRPQTAKPWLSPVSSRGSPYSTKRDRVPRYTTKQKGPGLLLHVTQYVLTDRALISPVHPCCYIHAPLWAHAHRVTFQKPQAAQWGSWGFSAAPAACCFVCCHLPHPGFAPSLTASWPSLSYGASADQLCHEKCDKSRP